MRMSPPLSLEIVSTDICQEDNGGARTVAGVVDGWSNKEREL